MFLTMMPLLLATTASPDPAWRDLWQACRSETSAEVRLACYDALSRETGRADSAADAPPADAFQLGREAGSGDLTLTRALADGNVLVIGCASNITHLRLTLSQPWQSETVTSSLDGVAAADTWFVRNRGLLLEFGRGLPAIDALKRWIGHRELVLNGGGDRVLRIDLAGLDQAVRPLRQQCRW